LADSTLGKNVDSLRSKELQISVAASSGLSKSDSIFQLKTKNKLAEADSNSVDSDTNEVAKPVEIAKKARRTAPLTSEEKELIDSVVIKRGYISNAFT